MAKKTEHLGYQDKNTKSSGKFFTTSDQNDLAIAQTGDGQTRIPDDHPAKPRITDDNQQGNG